MKTAELTRIALMTAVLCILAPISMPIPFSSVAFSLATFAIYLMAYILKPKQALVSVGLYLLLGTAGLPVFAGYLGGISRFASPNGGYLIGYLAAVGIGAWFVQNHAKVSLQIIGLLFASLSLYLIGTCWMAYTTGIALSAALWSGALLYLPFDIIKMLFAVYLGRKIQKHIK